MKGHNRIFLLAALVITVLAAACGGGGGGDDDGFLTPDPGVNSDASGGSSWSAIYGGAESEEIESVALTGSGDLLFAGGTNSFGDPTNDEGWVISTNVEGQVLWQATYGGEQADMFTDIQPTSDGGAIVAGWTQSFGVGETDMWVLKLDDNGAIEWQKAYGGPGIDQAWSVVPLSAGGYVVAGGTTSFGAGLADYWVLKLDDNGAIEWQKAFGGPMDDGGGGDFAEFVVRAFEDDDGNIIVGSESASFGAGNGDIWVLKLAPDGQIVWQKAYGGGDEDTMWDLAKTTDGSYIVPGNTVSFSGDGSGDIWVLKLDKTGSVVWERTYGVTGIYDEALSVGATSDGGALIGGAYYKSDDWGFVLVRVGADGSPAWQLDYQRTWDWPNAMVELEDGSLVVAGVAWGGDPAPDVMDLWAMRLGADGSLPSACTFAADITLDVQASSAMVTDTAAIVTETTATPVDTNATVMSSDAAPAFDCTQ